MCQPYIITSFTYYIAIFVNVRWWKLIFLNPCLTNKEGSFMGLNFCRCRSVLSVFVSIGTLTHLMALDPRKINHFPWFDFARTSSHSSTLLLQAGMKLNEQQLAALSSPKAVKQFLENQRENITNVIKQNLAVGDIFKRENLQVRTCLLLTSGTPSGTSTLEIHYRSKCIEHCCSFRLKT